MFSVSVLTAASDDECRVDVTRMEGHSVDRLLVVPVSGFVAIVTVTNLVGTFAIDPDTITGTFA